MAHEVGSIIILYGKASYAGLYERIRNSTDRTRVRDPLEFARGSVSSFTRNTSSRKPLETGIFFKDASTLPFQNFAGIQSFRYYPWLLFVFSIQPRLPHVLRKDRVLS